MTNKTIAEKKINRLAKLLNESGKYFVSPISEKQYCYEADVEDGNSRVKIQVYFGKKGVKTVVQGNREANLYKAVSEIVSGENEFFENGNIKGNEIIPEKYIGTDESGKGDFFGPLVVAAFFTDNEISKKLLQLNVRDSKTLTETQINEIAAKIKTYFPKNFSLFILEPEKYNLYYEKSGKNLNKLLAYAHSEAIKPLLKKFDVNFVVTDKFSNRTLDIQNETEYRNVRFYAEIKAEKYIGVAAASVLARSEVNRWFDEINFKLMKRDGIALPKGASSEVDKIAKIIVEKYGTTRLHRIMKLHFKNFSKIQ